MFPLLHFVAYHLLSTPCFHNHTTCLHLFFWMQILVRVIIFDSGLKRATDRRFGWALSVQISFCFSIVLFFIFKDYLYIFGTCIVLSLYSGSFTGRSRGIIFVHFVPSYFLVFYAYINFLIITLYYYYPYCSILSFSPLFIILGNGACFLTGGLK